MKNINYLLFTAFFLFGCATARTSENENISFRPSKIEPLHPQWEWKSMVGNWYSSETAKQGNTRQRLMQRFIDGSYKLTTKLKIKDKEISHNIEIGFWGISGPVYFSIFKGWVKHDKLAPSDTSNPDNYQAYKILELTDDQFKYQSFTTSSIVTLSRVSDDFIMPN